MFLITKQNDTEVYNKVEYIADTRTDIAELPTSVAPGSTCLVAADTSVWILTPQRNWIEL